MVTTTSKIALSMPRLADSRKLSVSSWLMTVHNIYNIKYFWAKWPTKINCGWAFSKLCLICQIQHNGAFLEIQIFALVSSIYLKLFSVATPMLYCKYFLSYRLDSKKSNTLALYTFLQRLILHVFNYAIITYGYFNIHS